eukprot:TRINITY_DN34595_c2_g1_i2.p1 TRINITY_DN34595_c2_g1~~TRINITY_DN34595_c2_g1_i2.p1  ORF type:complete len:114 (-),score=1.77 TRINITY_DN34595_c2_g1_i2:1721-2062(-)
MKILFRFVEPSISFFLKEKKRKRRTSRCSIFLHSSILDGTKYHSACTRLLDLTKCMPLHGLLVKFRTDQMIVAILFRALKQVASCKSVFVCVRTCVFFSASLFTTWSGPDFAD